MDRMKFNGDRVQLPWRKWIREEIEISPEGIYTPDAFIPIEQIHLLLWKAAVGYDRGKRVSFR